MLGGVRRELEFEGSRVRYRRFSNPGRPPLLLVHGGGGHGGWWSKVVPHLSPQFDLIVPDLSGNGDSDHRDTYSPELWAAELAAIVRNEVTGAISYVGHSMGGLVGIYFATRFARLTERLVLIDSGLREPAGKGLQPRGRERRATKRYPSEDAALARFRLRPGDTTADPRLLEAVGRQGIRRVEGGWTWKFDPAASQRFTDRSLHDQLVLIDCPLGIVYGEKSEVVGPENVAYVQRRVGRPVPTIEIPEAYHHVPLDAPSECAAAVEYLLQELGLTLRSPAEEGSSPA